MDPSIPGAYCAFTSPEYCYRAAAIIIRGYEGRGIHTLGNLTLGDGSLKRGLIYTWAPPEDGNPSEQYLNNVCNWTGVGPQTVLLRLGTLDVLRAMTRQESGDEVSKTIPDSTILLGITLSNPQPET